ncbi:MAG: nodulation efficiency protein D (NfeD) [Dysgonomonas sp.]|nr:nodulation efficiency protein D (NfeD) [Dysgonomonas sp.]
MALGIIIIICLILLGVALMMAEIFLLPGITVAGFAGGILMIGSIVYAFYYMTPTAGYITIGANIVIGIGTFFYLIKSNTLDKIALTTDIDSKVDQPEVKNLSLGDKGIAISRINPIGKAEFGDNIVEVKSFTGEFIDVEEKLIIMRIENTNIWVQTIHENEISLKK